LCFSFATVFPLMISQEPCDCIPTRVGILTCSRRLHMRTHFLFVCMLCMSLLYRYILDTKSSPIQKNEVYMMLEGRPVYQRRVEWAEWILKCVFLVMLTLGDDLMAVFIAGSVQSIIRWWRGLWWWWRGLLWWRWRTITRTSKDKRSCPSCTRHPRRPLQGQDHQISPHSKRALLKVPWERREGRRCQTMQ
jgi:hypothetical protein